MIDAGEPDDRTDAVREFERALRSLEKRPDQKHIARRLRTLWNRAKAEKADIEAAARCDPYYTDTPDMANEDARPVSGLWHRVWGGRWR